MFEIKNKLRPTKTFVLSQCLKLVICELYASVNANFTHVSTVNIDFKVIIKPGITIFKEM